MGTVMLEATAWMDCEAMAEEPFTSEMPFLTSGVTETEQSPLVLPSLQFAAKQSDRDNVLYLCLWRRSCLWRHHATKHLLHRLLEKSLKSSLLLSINVPHLLLIFLLKILHELKVLLLQVALNHLSPWGLRDH